MKTKYISLLIALAMLVTMGGVYAAWVYAETDMTAVHGHIGSFGLANAEINNSKGTITVDASNAHLTIDQTSATNYNANLTATGTILVKFSPSEIYKNSNPDKTEFAMKYHLVTDNANPTAFMCNDGNPDKPLFTTFDTTTTAPLTLIKQADGTYQATVQATELLTLMDIDTFKLDTHAKYVAFSSKVGTFGNIGVEVSEA